jgi:hypothetical protein
MWLTDLVKNYNSWPAQMDGKKYLLADAFYCVLHMTLQLPILVII